MASWIKLQEKINDLYQEAKKLEDKLIMAGREYVKGLNFDIVVVDEATQSVEPSTLIPIIKGKKFILAGDHKQLPPTVLNPEAEKYLQITLFERLVKM